MATLGVFGPHLGTVPGYVVSQGEVLVQLLSAAGHEVIEASHHPGRLQRAADTVTTVLRSGRRLDVAIVAVFSGPGFAMAELTCAALRSRGVPTVLVLRGGNLPAFAARHPRRVRRLLKSAARVVAPSPYLAGALGDVTEIAVIPNLLPLDRYPTSTRSPARRRLLWMRTFHPIYRPELAVDVVELVRQTYPDVVLTMAGQDKGLLDATRRRCAALGLNEAVTCAGFLGPAEKYEAFANHDVFLSTNAVDNTPVSLLEAAASGLVIVAADAGGISSLIRDRENGLVTDGNPTALAARVVEVFRDPVLAERLSLGAQRLGASSTRPSIAEAWEGLIDNIIKTRRRRRA